jgi:hypothetical protein
VDSSKIKRNIMKYSDKVWSYGRGGLMFSLMTLICYEVETGEPRTSTRRSGIRRKVTQFMRTLEEVDLWIRQFGWNHIIHWKSPVIWFGKRADATSCPSVFTEYGVIC